MDKYHPTYYRMMDYGENPMAASLIAIMPWGDRVVFAEYYESGNSIAKNCQKITEEMCGNSRTIIAQGGHEFEGHSWDIYEEVMSKIEFYASEMDSRSFGRDTHYV